jgi:hypothetical protein
MPGWGMLDSRLRLQPPQASRWMTYDSNIYDS